MSTFQGNSQFGFQGNAPSVGKIKTLGLLSVTAIAPISAVATPSSFLGASNGSTDSCSTNRQHEDPGNDEKIAELVRALDEAQQEVGGEISHVQSQPTNRWADLCDDTSEFSMDSMKQMIYQYETTTSSLSSELDKARKEAQMNENTNKELRQNISQLQQQLMQGHQYQSNCQASMHNFEAHLRVELERLQKRVILLEDALRVHEPTHVLLSTAPPVNPEYLGAVKRLKDALDGARAELDGARAELDAARMEIKNKDSLLERMRQNWTVTSLIEQLRKSEQKNKENLGIIAQLANDGGLQLDNMRRFFLQQKVEAVEKIKAKKEGQKEELNAKIVSLKDVNSTLVEDRKAWEEKVKALEERHKRELANAYQMMLGNQVPMLFVQPCHRQQ